MASKVYKAGIIGYGTSANVFHIPFLTASPSFTVHAIVQRSGDSAKEAHPDSIIYRSTDELLNDKDIDLVILCTPVQTHFDMAKQALKAGKHVVVEKPFCPTSEECDQLIQLSKAEGKLLIPFQNRRWDVEFLTLQKVIAEGHLGRVVEFSSHYDLYLKDLPGFWGDMITKPGGSLLHGLGTHIIDQALVLFGLPSKVTGFLQAQHAEGVHDAFTVLFHYENGPLVTLKSSLLSPETEQLRFWIRGDKGSYRKCHIDPQEPQINDGMKLDDPQFGKEDESKYGILTVSADDGTTRKRFESGKLDSSVYPNVEPQTYVKFYDLIGAALDGKGEIPVKPEDSRDGIKLIELATASFEKGITIDV
ncbi:oxidoreductase [Dactylonectria estremocensis]|uniref:Oxidoreductase n=1 Tax=Dactylonectria estremocensis TaxID=1079267 RepID=A0A9P9FKN1_9HYPO|nr:oxidoreductase [Dactylonectria estremocensis]